MKRLTVSILALGICAAAFAADDLPQLGPRAEKFIKEGLPVCSADVKLNRVAIHHKLPENMVGSVVQVDSERGTCQGQWVTIVTTGGDFFMGVPWFLDGTEGTLEQKIKDFVWKALQQNAEPVISRTRNRDGLFNVTLNETTTAGRMPMEGEVDPAGTVFFVGRFMPLSGDIRNERVQAFEPYLGKSPVTGAAKPVVTVVEFSDFECPSCQRASAFMKPIMDKFGEKVRYVRYDLPLVTMHPWAFSAAMAGRAVYAQKPDLFWTFKHDIYDAQEKLSAFTIDKFARDWAQDHDLDLRKFDADYASEETRALLLKGAGAAFTNDVRATPTYVVNGVQVDPGNDGKALEAYVAKLLK